MSASTLGGTPRRLTVNSNKPTLERQSAKYALNYTDPTGGERLSVSFDRGKKLPGIKIEQGGTDMVFVDAGEDLEWLIAALTQIREDWDGPRKTTFSRPPHDGRGPG